MSDGIFHVRDDGSLVPMRATPFESEAVFQELLAQHPSMLAGDAMDPDDPDRWLLVAREQAVPGEEGGAGRWSLDHLFIDRDGVPTLVEVKRASDTRARREVVAQMLDYAANGVVYWPAESLRQQFERTCAADGRDPDEALRAVLADPEGDPGAFWARVDVNLRAGRIRMVFVADIIHPELKRIVEFLNAQMSPADVIALELRHYSGQGQRTLVPRLIGRTAEAERRKDGGGKSRASGGPRLVIEEWIARFEAERSADEVAVARSIREWWVARGAEFEVDRYQTPGLVVRIDLGAGVIKPASIRLDGRASTNLFALTTRPPLDREDVRREVVTTLRGIAGMTASEKAFNGEPNIQLARLADPTARDRLFAVWDGILTRVRAGA